VPAGLTRGDRSASTVLALDNVPLELPVAGAGSRSLAAALDYVAVGILAVLWSVAAFAAWAGLAGEVEGFWAALGVALYLLGLFAIEYGYVAGSEVLTQGRTIGKWALSLQVFGRDGTRPATSALMLRNLVRTVDLVVGIPLMAIDPSSRRLGDRLAGTLVLAVPRSREEVPLARTPRGWGGREVAFLEDLLRRADELPRERRETLARRTVEWIRRVDPGFFAGIADPVADPVAALREASGVASSEG
jgi:uncharacterized RDD family membrane protein YckC